MKKLLIVALAIFGVIQLAGAQKNLTVVNPNIDMQGYLKAASERPPYRESRRLSEEDFIRMSDEPGTDYSRRSQ